MSRDLEAQVIGHLLDNPGNYHNHTAAISEKLFAEPDLREVYVRFVKLIREGRIPDFVNLSHTKEERLKLMKLRSAVIYDIDFSAWLDGLALKWKERRLEEILIKTSQDKKDVDAAIANLQQELASLGGINVKEPKQVALHIKSVIDVIDANFRSKGLTGIDTGLVRLNNITGGWQGGDLVVVAGDTSQGKTSLALQFARTAAFTGTAVGIYSYEMSATQLTARLIAQETSISAKAILTAKLQDEQVAAILKKVGRLGDSQIYIDECTTTRLDYLLNSMTALHHTRGAHIFIVDYLQLLSNPGKNFNKEQEVASIARELKNFARRTNTTVLLLSQLNRGQNKRTNGVPMLSDLRDSGQIEEAADIVLFTYRPEYYNVKIMDDGSSSVGKAMLILAKGRNIGLGNFTVRFNKELTMFEDG